MKTFTATISPKGLAMIDSDNTDNTILESPVPTLADADAVLASYRLRRLEGWEVRYEPDARMYLAARCVRLPLDF